MATCFATPAEGGSIILLAGTINVHPGHWNIHGGGELELRAGGNNASLSVECGNPKDAYFVPFLVVNNVLWLIVIVFTLLLHKKRATAKVTALHALNQTEKRRRSSSERLKASLAKENEELKASLKQARAMVSKVMSEGGTVLDAVKLKWEEIAFEEPIGMGAFGTVYRAEYREMKVAVKTVRSTKVTEATLREFKKEIVVMAPLRHECLVELVGACWDGGPDRLALVLEFCAGGSLDCLLRKDDGFSWLEPYFNIMLGAAKALKYLHHDKSGDPMIHRDIKPANILVTAERNAKIADFGCSRTIERMPEDACQTMTMTGTPLYVASAHI